ncbi:MAG: cation-transporting P-type ATPase, partial [Burkholderiales bacterium]
MTLPGWHAIEASEVAEHLHVDPGRGLDESEAAARLKQYGPNRPSIRNGRDPFTRFLSQLVQPLVLVLIASGGVTVLLGEWIDAGVIFGVVLLNALIGFIQEGKAEEAL